jgi:hypothetical protein
VRQRTAAAEKTIEVDVILSWPQLMKVAQKDAAGIMDLDGNVTFSTDLAVAVAVSSECVVEADGAIYTVEPGGRRNLVGWLVGGRYSGR